MTNKNKQQDIIKKFQQTAVRQTIFTYAIILCIGFLFISQMFPDTSLTGIDPEWEFRGVVILGGLLLIVSAFHWRCPACRAFLGFKIGLRACPRCKARFKEEPKKK